jgi:FkbM family methyltransferase
VGLQRNYAPKIVAELRRRGLLPSLFLFDVGASGGLPAHYRSFADRLAGVGFDPVIAEVERLNRAEQNPLVSYEAAWIGCENYDALFPPETWQPSLSKNDHPWHRLSAPRAIAAMAAREKSAAAAEHASERYSLDQYAARNGVGDLDMIKIDTDGHDFEVLLGAEAAISGCGVLGIEIEVQLHGPEHPYANVFHNIDRFLRGHGFSLFDFSSWRYSRAALPSPFVYGFPAQTRSGQVLWADAVYLRDLADPDYPLMHVFAQPRDKLLKLCCLFEIFELPDCAAELLLKLGREGILDPDLCAGLLDQLAPPGENYTEFIARFDRDPTAFYPTRT